MPRDHWLREQRINTIVVFARAALLPGTPLNLDQASRLIARIPEYYNTVRLHAAIAYLAAQDKLPGKDTAIFAARDHKPALARPRRKINRQSQPAHPLFHTQPFPIDAEPKQKNMQLLMPLHSRSLHPLPETA